MIEYLLLYFALKEEAKLIAIHNELMLAEVREGRKFTEASEIHIDAHLPASLYIPIGKHLEIHNKGLKVISCMPSPSEVEAETIKETFNEVLQGNLEHWSGMYVGKITMRQIASVGVSKSVNMQ